MRGCCAHPSRGRHHVPIELPTAPLGTPENKLSMASRGLDHVRPRAPFLYLGQSLTAGRYPAVETIASTVSLLGNLLF